MSEQVNTPKGVWLTNGLLIGEIVAIIGVLIAIQSQIQTQSQRSDDLYKQFIDLVKTDHRCPVITPSFKPYFDQMPQPNDWKIKDPSVGV